MALGLVSLTSKRRKVNKENSLGSGHASAHIMGDKDLRLKQHKNTSRLNHFIFFFLRGSQLVLISREIAVMWRFFNAYW